MSIVIDKQTRGSKKVPESQAPRAEASSRPYGRVYLVGAGPGDADLITLKGLRCIRKADVVVYDRLINPSLLDETPMQAERVFVGKEPRAEATHDKSGSYERPYMKQEEINALLITHARQGRKVVRLKGGDPFLFGRGGEEALALARAGIPFEVVPGVSSAIAVPAYAGIPVTHRGVASSFAVLTGHEDPSKDGDATDWRKLATAVDTLVVLMAVGSFPRIVGALLAHGRPPETPVA